MGRQKQRGVIDQDLLPADDSAPDHLANERSS